MLAGLRVGGEGDDAAAAERALAGRDCRAALARAWSLALDHADEVDELRRAVRMQTALVVDAARAGAFPRDTPDYPLDEAIPRRRAADCAVM